MVRDLVKARIRFTKGRRLSKCERFLKVRDFLLTKLRDLVNVR